MIHVVPLDDARPHDRSAGCWCGPRVEPADGDDLAVHNSADLREAYESAVGEPHPDGKDWGVFEGEAG